MSVRRKPGEWVWLKPNSGFVGESSRLKAEIRPEDDPPPCLCDCGDDECIEWSTLWTEEDEGGKRYMLCHVSECQMLDEPFRAEGEPCRPIGQAPGTRRPNVDGGTAMKPPLSYVYQDLQDIVTEAVKVGDVVPGGATIIACLRIASEIITRLKGHPEIRIAVFYEDDGRVSLVMQFTQRRLIFEVSADGTQIQELRIDESLNLERAIYPADELARILASADWLVEGT